MDEGKKPTVETDERAAFELPERVIDQLFQAAGVSTYHPDGDQLDKLHAFARNVVSETLARLPARASASQAETMLTELALNTRHSDCYKAADAFWQYWIENGVPHKHGYYESTWGAINQAIRYVGVVPHQYSKPKIEVSGSPCLSDCIGATRSEEYSEPITSENAGQRISDMLMECVERLGNFPRAEIHPHAWRSLLIYAPRDESAIETAYWEFDARRNGLSEWKGRPQTERDAFKWAVRAFGAYEANKPFPEAWEQLMSFYQVETEEELVSAMERHIERLQEKARQPISVPAFTRVREG